MTSQGLKAEGLELLKIARQETGLPIVTEIMSVADLPLFEDVDVIAGGRPEHAEFRPAAGTGQARDKPILLKRGLANTLKELLMSAEYIMAGGNEQVILCERGIRTFDDLHPQHPGSGRRPHAPRADPPAGHRGPQPRHRHQPAGGPHGHGRHRLPVPTASSSRSTTTRIHALCDGAQSLRPEQFDVLAGQDPRDPGGRDGMTVGIVGLGLIGGSFAKAYHEAGHSRLGM